MDALPSDLRFGLRSLLRKPEITLAAILAAVRLLATPCRSSTASLSVLTFAA